MVQGDVAHPFLDLNSCDPIRCVDPLVRTASAAVAAAESPVYQVFAFTGSDGMNELLLPTVGVGRACLCWSCGHGDIHASAEAPDHHE